MFKTWYRKYLVPGFVFQSIVIGGGYGTGRELVEFFLTDGPAAGYLGMATATLIWSAVLALGFNLARIGRCYDYRTYLKILLGRGWIVFECLYLTTIVLSTAVVGAASGELFRQGFGLPYLAGVLAMVGAVAFLAARGSSLIEMVFSSWSLVLYGVYLVLLILVFNHSGDAVVANASIWQADAPWVLSGARYAAYNLAALPAVLFSLRHLNTQREALCSGLCAGVIAMLPGAMVYTALVGEYPGIVDAPVPVYALIDKLGQPMFATIFHVVLFGTFIETATGLIHGFNERIAGAAKEKGRKLSKWMRLWIAAALLAVSVGLAEQLGLVVLIAKGYGYITWGYWVFFVLPVLFVGTWKIFKSSEETS